MMPKRPSVREILGVYRENDPACAEERFAQALHAIDSDPDLARWWEEEKRLDAAFGEKLRGTHLPAGLKERMLTARDRSPAKRFPMQTAALLAAACFLALAVVVSLRGPLPDSTRSLANFRDEMAGFVKVPPTLEMTTSRLADATAFLQKTSAPSEIVLPKKLQELEPVGCRTLRFGGNNVALICFKRSDGRLLHLFVAQRKALPHFSSGAGPNYAAQGEWMTATWSQGDQVYLMMAQGDRAALENYLANS